MSITAGTIIGGSEERTKSDIDGESPAHPDTSASVGNEGRNNSAPIESQQQAEPVREFKPTDTGFEPVGAILDGATGAGAGEPIRRKPGRQKGWRKQAETAVPPSLAQLDFAAILVSGHSMLAALTGVQELDIEVKEGQKLADCLKAALKFHNALISPEKLAYINLSFAVCEIYGTRALAYRMRKAEERKRMPQKMPTPIRQTPAPAPAPPTQAAAAPETWFQPVVEVEAVL